ncbi:hypothetical protein HYY73_00315 [Candidatus Woesearchaeota archaeon]|nr:hypothetical protein [Candidatus Woesearchaeota archaeon]
MVPACFMVAAFFAEARRFGKDFVAKKRGQWNKIVMLICAVIIVITVLSIMAIRRKLL